MSKRNRKSSDDVVKTVKKKVESSWIFLIKDEIFNDGSFEIITIPHPASNNPTKYCINDKSVYEIMTYDEPYRSWFLDNTVKSDGNIQIVTQINPLFLILPKLKAECSTRAIPLEDLLSEKGYDKIINVINNLDKIADLKGKDVKAYKYNEDKTLDWLENKVKNVVAVLKQKNIHVTQGAVSATFVSSDNDVDNDFYLKYAFELISRYLREDIAQLLEKRFNFKDEIIETLSKKRKSEIQENGVANKKLKTEDTNHDHKENIVLNSKPAVTDTKKAITLTPKEIARQKSASGTKTISSFFKKK